MSSTSFLSPLSLSLIAFGGAAGGLAGCTDAASDPAATRDVCAEVSDLVASCTGERPAPPVEGCVGSFRDDAEDILAAGCDGLEAAGKGDATCTSGLSWTGVCETIPLAQVAALSTVDEVCPVSRGDALCGALRSGDPAAARAAVAAQLGGPAAEQAIADPAVRFYVRERTVALLVWNVLTDRGRSDAPADYAAAADAVLDEHYPAYAGVATAFAMARQPLAPRDGTSCLRQDVIAVFPGVARMQVRTEFAAQAEAIKAAIPCLRTIVLDTDSFVAPAENAALASRTLAGEPGGLHLIGYSQGASNALQTLVDDPALAARTRTVLTLNSAAHGSEVVDVLLPALDALDQGPGFCATLPEAARPTCEDAAARSGQPARVLMEEIAVAMAIPVDALDGWIDPTDRVTTLAEFLRRHKAGVRSLTTRAAAEFWAGRGAELPRGLLYTSFRSAVTDPAANLPLSNALFYALLQRAGGNAPYNDMQVLVGKQSLGGPVADREVVLPVAEGNHWQWEYTEGQLDEALMPAAMTARIPQRELLVAYVQALFDAGVVQ